MTDPVVPAGDSAPPAVSPDAPGVAANPGDAAAAPIALTAQPLASVIAKPKSSGGRGTSLLLVLAGAIAIGGIAFAAGRVTAPTAATTAGRFGNGQLPGNGQQPGNGQLPAGAEGFPGRDGGFGGMSLAGTVSAVSGDSITITLESGTSITIPLDAETTYHAAAATTAGDVTVGSEVRVMPGARVASPAASFDLNASPGPGGSVGFGAASDVTIVEP
jgi:hypothetical protein